MCQHQATASDFLFYDIFARTKNFSFEVSDDVIACSLWFGPPPQSKILATPMFREIHIYPTYLSKLITLQNKTLRIVSGSECYQNVLPLNQKSKLLNLLICTNLRLPNSCINKSINVYLQILIITSLWPNSRTVSKVVLRHPRIYPRIYSISLRGTLNLDGGTPTLDGGTHTPSSHLQFK